MSRDQSIIIQFGLKNCISNSFVGYEVYSIFSEVLLPTIVDIMVI